MGTQVLLSSDETKTVKLYKYFNDYLHALLICMSILIGFLLGVSVATVIIRQSMPLMKIFQTIYAVTVAIICIKNFMKGRKYYLLINAILGKNFDNAISGKGIINNEEINLNPEDISLIHSLKKGFESPKRKKIIGVVLILLGLINLGVWLSTLTDVCFVVGIFFISIGFVVVVEIVSDRKYFLLLKKIFGEEFDFSS